MLSSIRITSLMTILVLAVGSAAPAATPKEIDAAIKKGTDHLKLRYAKGVGIGGSGGATDYGIGPACLVGLALLEGGVPVTDDSVKSITEMVRNASYSQNKTYQTSLCLMYLDRFGDPSDVVRIQMLAVRLLVGQSAQGGWTYEACPSVSGAHEQVLRTLKSDHTPGKLHPDIEKYGQTLARGGQNPGFGGDDNSNTQFAIIAVWLARKHGVPVDPALDLIERRFLGSQNPRTGGWSYTGPASGVDGGFGSPAMHCAGLIGLATAVARREERRAKKDEPKKEEAPKVEPKSGINPKQNPDDPFFNPPKPSGPELKKQPAKALDHRDRAVQLSLSGMGMILGESARAGRGALVLKNSGSHGDHDLYFFWSLERVGVIYGLEKVGGVDWYDAGAHALVTAQAADGSWGGGMNAADVNTSFAILFLCKSNLARDLSSKVQKEVSTEMRAGAGPTEVRPVDPASNPNALIPNPVLPGPTGSEASKIAGELLRASDKDWPALLKKIRDAKGPINTQALVACVNRLEGDRRKAAREALAERLTRMTGETLRTMAKDEDTELRRGAVLAMAMKDDKAHFPDLIAALLDDEEVVVRAAKAGLKSLTGQDFGPDANATAVDKRSAVSAWNDWLSKQKK